MSLSCKCPVISGYASFALVNLLPTTQKGLNLQSPLSLGVPRISLHESVQSLLNTSPWPRSSLRSASYHEPSHPIRAAVAGPTHTSFPFKSASLPLEAPGFSPSTVSPLWSLISMSFIFFPLSLFFSVASALTENLFLKLIQFSLDSPSKPNLQRPHVPAKVFLIPF